MQRCPLGWTEGRGDVSRPQRHEVARSTTPGFSDLRAAFSTQRDCPLTFAGENDRGRKKVALSYLSFWEGKKKKKLSTVKDGAPRSLLTAHSTQMNEISRNESNDLKTIRAHCSCTQDHVAGSWVLGTPARLSPGPRSEGTDSVAHHSAT